MSDFGARKTDQIEAPKTALGSNNRRVEQIPLVVGVLSVGEGKKGRRVFEGEYGANTVCACVQVEK
jgi:hypothetical protein